jgi:hypothetical protein
MTQAERWHALEVAPRKERRIARLLASRGFEGFLPEQSDRDRTLLFEGVVFCRFCPAERQNVLATSGVQRILAIAGQEFADAPVKGLRRLIDSGRRYMPWRRSVGEPVRVEQGPLEGLTGRLAAGPEFVRIVVGWNGLHGKVAVDLEDDFVAFMSSHAEEC